MKTILNRFRLLRLKWRECILDAQADHAQELILDHTARYDMLCKELRRVRSRIATLTPAAEMLAELNQRKGA